MAKRSLVADQVLLVSMGANRIKQVVNGALEFELVALSLRSGTVRVEHGARVRCREESKEFRCGRLRDGSRPCTSPAERSSRRTARATVLIGVWASTR